MRRISIKKLIFTIVILLALSFGAMCADGLFSAEELPDVFRILSDGFFIAGAVFVGISLLKWIGSDGQFDSLAFTVKTLLSLKWSVFGNFREKYLEYKEEKKRNGLPVEMMLTGVAAIAVAALFLLLC